MEKQVNPVFHLINQMESLFRNSNEELRSIGINNFTDTYIPNKITDSINFIFKSKFEKLKRIQNELKKAISNLKNKLDFAKFQFENNNDFSEESVIEMEENLMNITVSLSDLLSQRKVIWNDISQTEEKILRLLKSNFEELKNQN